MNPTNEIPQGWRRWLWFARSRKVQVALATVVTAVLVDLGLNVDEQLVLVVVATGASIILGIAIEDHGTKSAGK